jgi:hypothetical protein
MIKNLLYSLFLHLILIAAIYANFNIKIHEEEELSEIVISMSILPIQGSDSKEPSPVSKNEKKIEEAKIKTKSEEPKEIKKEKVKKTKSKTKEIKKKEIVAPKKELKTPKKEDKKESKEKNLKKETEEKIESNKKQEEAPPTPEEDKEPLSKDPEIEELEDTSNSIENLNLSAREKLNIQSQLRLCYKRAIAESRFKAAHKIIIKASIDENGFINSNIEELSKSEKYNETDALKASINNVKRAIDLCSPLRNLPVDKYEIWKDVTLSFDGEI